MATQAQAPNFKNIWNSTRCAKKTKSKSYFQNKSSHIQGIRKKEVNP